MSGRFQRSRRWWWRGHRRDEVSGLAVHLDSPLLKTLLGSLAASFSAKSPMKKLTERYSKWLDSRSKNQARRSNKNPVAFEQSRHPRRKQYHNRPVRIWQGGEPEDAICTRAPTPAPSLLCFNNNAEQTINFLFRIRSSFLSGSQEAIAKFVTYRSERSIARIGGYVDFSMIKGIGTAAAVVLTADYQRLSMMNTQIPPTINLHQWTPEVVTKLYQMGFFNLLGHLPEDEASFVKDGPTLTMPILCARNADSLGAVDPQLLKLAEFLSGDEEIGGEELDATIVKVITTISEAITNVTQHAYPSEYQYEFQHVGSFWVAATADRDKQTLTIVVYDQGASIPITYPKIERSKRITRFLRRALSREAGFDYADDGTYIRAALRYGGTRTNEPYRGKGFPQMFEILQSVGLGTLRVRSRGGWCSRTPNGRVKSGSLPSSIGGTLVEWEIEIRPEIWLKEK